MPDYLTQFDETLDLQPVQVSFDLAERWRGKTCVVQSDITVEIPPGMKTGLVCKFLILPSASISFTTLPGVTLDSPIGGTSLSDPYSILELWCYRGNSYVVKYASVPIDLHLNGYPTLSTAISSIGASPAVLWIKRDITVSSDITVPDNITLVIDKGAVVTVTSGNTLTINAFRDPGNVLCFAGSGDVIMERGTSNKYRTAWWTGPDDEVNIDTAMTKAIASATAVAGTVILVPRGIWETSGSIQLPDYTTVEGEADYPFYDVPTTRKSSIFKMTSDSAGVFLFGTTTTWGVSFKNILIDGDLQTDVVGILMESGVNVGHDIWCYGVEIRSCRDGFYAHKSNPSATIVFRARFDRKCRIVFNTESAMRVDCENTVIEFAGYMGAGISSGGTGIKIEGAGCGYFNCKDAEMGGSLGGALLGTRQIISQAVVAASGITADGNAKCVVTRAGMPGSPYTVTFPVTTTEHTNATWIARAAARALARDPVIMERFNVGWYNTNLFYLQILDPEANDGTFNVTIENDTCTGITDDTTSTTAVSGAAGTSDAWETLFEITGPARMLHVHGCWIEGVRKAIRIAVPDIGVALTNISFHGGYVGGNIEIDGGGGGHLTLDSVLMHVKAIRGNANGNLSIAIEGTTGYIDSGQYYAPYGFEQVPSNIGMKTTTGTVIDGITKPEYDTRTRLFNSRVKIVRNLTDNGASQDPWLQVVTPNTVGRQFRLGALDNESKFIGYDIFRSTVDGLLYFEGNQSSFRGYAFDDKMRIHDSSYTLQSPFSPGISRLSMSSTSSQNTGDNHFVGSDLYANLNIQNSTAGRFFIGRRTEMVLGGGLGNTTNIMGHYVNVVSTWAPASLVSSAYGVHSTVDIAANAGAGTLCAGRFRAIVGSVNVGAVTTIAGVIAYGNYGYSATVTDAIGVQANTQSASNFGGTAQNVKLFHSVKGTTNSNATNVAGLWIGDWLGGTGTLTNVDGIYIDTTIDVGTNRYAIRSLSTSKSMLTGALILGGHTAQLNASSQLEINKDAANAIQLMVAYGTARSGMLDGYAARGSRATPTASQSDDTLFLLTARGYGATAFPSSSRFRMLFAAGENWTDAAQGTYLSLFITAIGGVTTSNYYRFYSSSLNLASGLQLGWTSGSTNPSLATLDTGLARASAGTVKVTTGGANRGSLEVGNLLVKENAASGGDGVTVSYSNSTNDLLFDDSAIGNLFAFKGADGAVQVKSAARFAWSSTSSAVGSLDTSLQRYSAGVIKVSNAAQDIRGLLGGGSSVASAAALPLPTGRVFHVTGTTNITSITSTGFGAGAVITLIFDGVLTFTDGSNLKLAGNFVTAADSTISLVYDGTNWYELSRSVN